MSDETWPEAPALPERPWRALPPELVATLGSELDVLGDETIAAIGAEIAEYARPLEGRFGRNLRRGVQESLRRFVALVGDATAPAGPLPPIYRQLGAGEWRDGRSLDALQAAYRLGARVAWRRLGAAAAAEGASPDTLRLLAESIFAYIDELAGESVAGYAEAQAAEAGAREGRRRALAELLVLSPPADPDALAAAARSAGWRLPREIAAIVVARPQDHVVATALDPAALSVADVILVPDPGGPGRRQAFERVLAGHVAAIGPAVPPREAARSLRWARTTLALLPLDHDGPVFAEDRLVDLALADGAEPLAALRTRRLAALDALPPGRRDRLAQTLGAWLAHHGSAPGAAAELNLHPQTVRYRLAQLREVLPEQIDDPAARLELALALRAPPG